MDPDPQATRAFADLVTAGPDVLGARLEEAALLVAAHAKPGLDAQASLAELDALAALVDPGSGLAGLLRALYGEAGFGAPSAATDDPRNSFLDDVLARRRGLPIMLAVVAIAVGRRCGVPVVGVGMPGHFLFRPADDHDRFVEPLRGLELRRAGCEALYREVMGPGAPWDESFLAPSAPEEIVARILANLRNAYARRSDAAAIAWVVRLRLLVPGTPPGERVDLAGALAGAGRWREAADELDAVAELGVVEDEASLRRRALALRARLN